MSAHAPSPFGPRPVVVGHRGAPRVHRENTAASFAAAAAAGAAWVELDVRLDADGVAVVHHDPVLPDGRALIAMGTAACVAAGVATLESVLEGLPDGLGVDLEIKNFPGEPDHDESMQVVAVTAAVLGRVADPTTGAGTRPLMISSFNPMVLLAAAEGGLPHPLGLLTISLDLAAAIDVATELGCAAVCPNDATAGLDAGGIAAAHDAALGVLVWTVDDPGRAIDLVGAGVDAVCTNDPAGIVAALPAAAAGAALTRRPRASH